MGHAMSAEDVKRHERTYLRVFAALGVLTVITVGVAELQFLSAGMAIVVALLVATIKGSLVACYFMHLISERKMLYGILILCAIFFFVLLLLPTMTISDNVHV